MTRHDSRSPLVLALLLVVLAAAVATARPVEAGVSFHVGGGFTVGGLHFHVGVHDYDTVRYYRVDRPLVVAGAHCTDRCYVRGGYHYHHPSCPLVRAYFREYGYRAIESYGAYAPRPYVVYPAPRPSYRVRVYPSYRHYRPAPRHYEVRHPRYDRRHHRYDHRRHDHHQSSDHRRNDRRDHRGRSDHRHDRHHR